MGNEVKIIISAVDRASSELNKVGGGFSGLEKAMGAVIGVGAAAGYAIKKMVDSTVEYGKQVGDFSRALGTSAEESSKLIQIADDLRIETGTLKMGFKKALMEGVNPSIDGIKQLAREYQALNSPVEKAQFSMKYFGRAGLELNKILELTPRQLDEMAKSAEEAGLVLSQDAVDATNKYHQEVDQLNDSLEGLKTQLSIGVLPFVTDFVKELNELGKADGFREYMAVLKKYSGTFGTWGDDVKKFGENTYNLGVQAQNTTYQVEELSTDLGYVSHAALQGADGLGFFYSSLTQTQAAAENAAPSIDAAAKATGRWIDQINRDITSNLEDFWKDMEWRMAGGAGIEKKAAEIQQAVNDHKITPQQGIEFTKELYIGAVDLQEEIGQIDWQTAVDKLTEAFGVSAKEAAKWLRGTEGPEQALTAITSKPWYIDIYYREHNRPTGVSTTDQEVEYGGKKALGGPVVPGLSYIVGENGPEWFTPNAAGNITPHGAGTGGDTFIDINVFGAGQSPQVLAGLVAIELEKRTRYALRAGAGYAGY